MYITVAQTYEGTDTGEKAHYIIVQMAMQRWFHMAPYQGIFLAMVLDSNIIMMYGFSIRTGLLTMTKP